MKHFLLPLLLSIILLSCNEPKEIKAEIQYSADLEEFELTRPARKITEIEIFYTDSFGVNMDSSRYENHYYFDSLGNQVKSERWNIPSKHWMVELWKYDNNGRKDSYSFEKGTPCGYTAQYLYDSSNRLIRKELFGSDDTLMNIETYAYDPSGKLIGKEIQLKHRICGASGSAKYVYEYDIKGRKKRIESHFEDGVYIQTNSYSGDTTFHMFGTSQIKDDYTVQVETDSSEAWILRLNYSRWSHNKIRITETRRIIEYY